MSANIFNFFKRLSLNHNIHYINCVEDPEKAAFGFIRTQLLNGKDPKDKYQHYVVNLESETDAVKFMEMLPEIIRMADLIYYKCIYYRDGREVHVVFNSVDMNGHKFGFLEECSFRLASKN